MGTHRLLHHDRVRHVDLRSGNPGSECHVRACLRRRSLLTRVALEPEPQQVGWSPQELRQAKEQLTVRGQSRYLPSFWKSKILEPHQENAIQGTIEMRSAEFPSRHTHRRKQVDRALKFRNQLGIYKNGTEQRSKTDCCACLRIENIGLKALLTTRTRTFSITLPRTEQNRCKELQQQCTSPATMIDVSRFRGDPNPSKIMQLQCHTLRCVWPTIAQYHQWKRPACSLRFAKPRCLLRRPKLHCGFAHAAQV